MNNVEIATEMGRLSAQLLAQLQPVITTGIDTPDALGRALAAAAPGATLYLSPSLVYPTFLTVGDIALVSTSQLGGRMTATDPAPTFRGGLAAFSNTHLHGLDVRFPDPTRDIVVLGGANLTLRRMRIMGDAIEGAKRGVAANAAAVTITDSFIDQCFRRDMDAQAICAWDGPGPFTVDNCYLTGSGQAIMFGGGDPSSATNIPSDISITNSTLTKRNEWRAAGVAVKTVLELKNARRVRVANCDISQCWAGGQVGYLIMITPRNQDGGAPYSTVEDVLIESCTAHDGAAFLNILGTDDNNPSQRVKRVTVRDTDISALDPWAWGGSDKAIMLGNGPEDVTLDGLRFRNCVHIGSQVYFYGAPAAARLALTNCVLPPSDYGIFGDNSSVGHAWEQYTVNSVRSGNTEATA